MRQFDLVELLQNSPGLRFHSIVTNHSATDSKNYIQFNVHHGGGIPYTGQKEVLNLLGNGNVGIGTTIPRAKFDVRPGGHSGDGAILFTHNIGEVGSSNNAIQSIKGDGSALQPLGYRATEHIFATQAAEKLRITSTGEVNIGGDYAQTTNKFQVTGNAKNCW